MKNYKEQKSKIKELINLAKEHFNKANRIEGTHRAVRMNCRDIERGQLYLKKARIEERKMLRSLMNF